MNKAVKIIDAPLCERCASMLGTFFKTTKTERKEDTACPWCEKKRAAAIYRLRVEK